MANPTTWSHLNDSQPRPNETSQMKRVRQVSIVLREGAETVLVTLRPKKLKPLERKTGQSTGDIPGAAKGGSAYPMLIMIKILDLATDGTVNILWRPSAASK